MTNAKKAEKRFNEMTSWGLKSQQKWMLQTRRIKPHVKDRSPVSHIETCDIMSCVQYFLIIIK